MDAHRPVVSPISAAALSLAGVSKVFGGLRAVSNVSLEVSVGERRVLIGPNGAGKTSLFHCISGAHQASAGTIACFGQDITRLSEFQRTAMGIGRTFQISSVFVELTVLENVCLAVLGAAPHKWRVWTPFRRVPGIVATAEEKIELVGLAGREELRVRNLSYGERRQLELALALANNPRLMLLDEPCAGLSPAERTKLFSLITALPRSITMLMIEHDMDIALGIADRVTVLHRGEVILEGTADEVRVNPQVREVYFGEV
jgi:branched-chain amino acid transport system ATP-binding protein